MQNQFLPTTPPLKTPALLKKNYQRPIVFDIFYHLGLGHPQREGGTKIRTERQTDIDTYRLNPKKYKYIIEQRQSNVKQFTKTYSLP